jgi:hypothetical protein
MHLIQEDLNDSWLDEACARTIAALEHYLSKWAAFADYLEARPSSSAAMNG